MLTRRRSPLARHVLLVAGLLAALLAAGCGDDGGAPGAGGTSRGPDPATLAPRDAAVYGEVVVRPEGELEEELLAAIRKVARIEDPGERIQRFIDESSREEGDDETYAHDLAPWLGQRAGGFMLMPRHRGEDPDGALIVAARDPDALRDTFAEWRREGDQRAGGTYRGVRYDVDAEDPDDGYAAVVDGFLVFGTLRGLRAAIDVAKGEPALADAARFATAAAPREGDAVAFAFAEPAPLLRMLSWVVPASPVGPGVQRFRQLLAGAEDAEPVTLALTARSDRIALDVAFGAGEEPEAAGGLTLADIPADAWLAFATPSLGDGLADGLGTPRERGAIERMVRQATGLDLERDLLGWLGGIGGYVRGTTPLDLAGALLLGSRDPEASERAVGRIGEAVERLGLAPTSPLSANGAVGFLARVAGLPQPIAVLAKGDEVAAGFAQSSARDALDPPQPFDESPAGEEAIASLGEGVEPWFVLSFPPLLELLDTIAGDDPDVRAARPYLRAYRSLALGTRRDGDRQTLRIVAALRDE